jgi:hypothetical protein
MTQREIARLACKVLAIWALFDALKAASMLGRLADSVVTSVRDGWNAQRAIFDMAFVIWPIAQVIAAVWLWRRAGVVAAWMTGHDLQDEPDEPDVSPRKANLDEVQSVVLSSLGVWMLLQTIPNAVHVIAVFLLAWSTSTKTTIDYASSWVSTNVWVWTAQFVLGIWMIFGASGIVRMLKRFRYVGLEPNERPPAAQDGA